MVLQEFYVIFHALLELWEWQEVDRFNFFCCRWVFLLESPSQVLILESEHAAVCVVEESNLARAKKLLRDYDAAQCLLSVERPLEM